MEEVVVEEVLDIVFSKNVVAGEMVSWWWCSIGLVHLVVVGS